MENRLKLHYELMEFMDLLYFNPPDNIQIGFPCIVYHRTGVDTLHGNNRHYLDKQEWSITLIEKNADSDVANQLVEHFDYCSIRQYFTKDNLHHTVLRLYY